MAQGEAPRQSMPAPAGSPLVGRIGGAEQPLAVQMGLGLDRRVVEAERAVAGKELVKRNRFIKLTDGQRAVNLNLETRARAIARLKAYITNMADPTPPFVIGAYHQLWHIRGRAPRRAALHTAHKDAPPVPIHAAATCRRHGRGARRQRFGRHGHCSRILGQVADGAGSSPGAWCTR